MHDIYISGTGVWTPPHKVSNKELVESFNEYVRLYNIENEQRILDGSVTALEAQPCSTAELLARSPASETNDFGCQSSSTAIR